MTLTVLAALQEGIQVDQAAATSHRVRLAIEQRRVAS